MTKKQKVFFDYLQKLENENPKFVETALKEFTNIEKKYDKDGVVDSMTIAIESTESFVGLPIKVHLN